VGCVVVRWVWPGTGARAVPWPTGDAGCVSSAGRGCGGSAARPIPTGLDWTDRTGVTGPDGTDRQVRIDQRR
jgi:hypothetical protein